MIYDANIEPLVDKKIQPLEDKIDKLIALTEQSLRNDILIMTTMRSLDKVSTVSIFRLKSQSETTESLLTNKDNSNG